MSTPQSIMFVAVGVTAFGDNHFNSADVVVAIGVLGAVAAGPSASGGAVDPATDAAAIAGAAASSYGSVVTGPLVMPTLLFITGVCLVLSRRCGMGASGSDLRGIAFSTGAIGGAKILGGGCGEVVAIYAGVPGSVPLGVAVDAGRCGPTSGETYGGASSARRLRGARDGEAISFPCPFPFGTREL
jgi:hypothetical protein